MVGKQGVATVASAVCFYSDSPKALKVFFPKSGMEMGVKSIKFHPKFDQKLAFDTVQRGTMIISPESALQKFNCCILELDNELDFLSDSLVEQVSETLRYPLDLSFDGFRGSLKDIELPLVIQTLNNARKQGIIYICDDLMRPLAQVFVAEGKIVSAKYHNLNNELALYQIVEKRLVGRFAFFQCKKPVWLPNVTIKGTTDMVLIEAHRRLDELDQIRRQMVPGQTYFARAEKFCNTQSIPEELRKHAERLWQVLDATTSAEQLWLLVGLDDYNIYRTLKEMFISRQIVRIQEGGTKELETGSALSQPKRSLEFAPLRLQPHLSLEPHDQIVSLSIDATTSRPNVRSGTLLGAIDAFDSFHLLHDISLLPSCSGSPIFKDDMVIGMHCGAVTSSVMVQNSQVMLQQMLWIDAIVQMLDLDEPAVVAPIAPQAEAVARPAKYDEGRLAGCREVASFRCPNCSHRTFKSARSCMNCGFMFVPELAKQVGGLRLETMLPIIAAVVVLLVASGAYALTMIPPTVQWDGKVLFLPPQPAEPWVTADTMLYLGKTTGNFYSLGRNAKLQKNDHITYKVSANDDGYVYVICKESGAQTATLKYPTQGDSSYFTKGQKSNVGDGKLTTVTQDKATGQFVISDNFVVGGAPGVDQSIIIMVKGNKGLSWLSSDNTGAMVNVAFNNAQECLNLGGKPVGMLVHETDLSGGKLDSASRNVYITSVSGEHQ